MTVNPDGARTHLKLTLDRVRSARSSMPISDRHPWQTSSHGSARANRRSIEQTDRDFDHSQAQAEREVSCPRTRRNSSAVKRRFRSVDRTL